MNVAGRSSNYLLKVRADNQGRSQNRNPGFSSPICNALDHPDFVICQQSECSVLLSVLTNLSITRAWHLLIQKCTFSKNHLQGKPRGSAPPVQHRDTNPNPDLISQCLEIQGTSLTAVFHVWWCPHYKCWLSNHFFLAIKPWHKLRKSTVLVRKVR